MDDSKHLTLKDWPDDDKPREKMVMKGKKELTNAELIAILLRSGIAGKGAVEMAKDILQHSGNSLNALAQTDFKSLRSIKGLGIAKATTLMAALELGQRMLGEMNANKDILLRDSREMFMYLLPFLADLDHEEFWLISLSNRNKILGRQRVSLGGQTETSVDLRVLFRSALEHKAVKIIVAHNHPSGSLSISRQDRELTARIKQAGDILQIRLIDHIIVAIADNGTPDYVSFHDEGLL